MHGKPLASGWLFFLNIVSVRTDNIENYVVIGSGLNFRLNRSAKKSLRPGHCELVKDTVKIPKALPNGMEGPPYCGK